MNEILDEFKIILKIDDKPLNDGLKKSTSKIKEFAKMAGRALSAFYGLKALKSSINDFNALSLKVGKASSMLGVSTGAVSALGGALKRFGGGTDSAISSLSSLSSALNEAKWGGGALLDVSKKYGIEFQKSNGSLMNSTELLKSLSIQFKGLDKASQVDVGRSLGLDDSTIQLLQSGVKNYDRLMNKQREFGLVSKKDSKISNDFNEAVLDLRDSFNGLMKDFNRLIIPLLTKIFSYINKFISFLKKHKMLLIGFFGALVVAMAPLIASFATLAVEVAIAFAPLFLIGAVLAGVALVVEDIWGYFNGMDSITGDLVKKFPLLDSILRVIVTPVIAIKEAFSAIMKLLDNPTWDNFKNVFIEAGKNILKWVKEPLENVINALKNLWGWMKKFGGEAWSDIKTSIGLNGDAVSGKNVTNSNNYNVNANINQNIASATPKALADQTGQLLIDSINSQRYQVGGN